MIYVCIPVHNEASTIGVLLWKIRKVMADFERDYEVVVLDDASTDETGEVLQRYVAVLPLQILREENRLGYAGALERLLRNVVKRAPYPKRDSIVTLQGDFTESPEYIIPLVKALEGGADVVAGVLERGASRVPRGVRFARLAAPWILGRAHRAAPVTDPLTGYRAYRVIVLKKALRDRGDAPLITGQGWAANLRLLGEVAPHARRVEEVGIDQRHDRRVRKSRFRALETLRELARSGRGIHWPAREAS